MSSAEGHRDRDEGEDDSEKSRLNDAHHVSSTRDEVHHPRMAGSIG